MGLDIISFQCGRESISIATRSIQNDVRRRQVSRNIRGPGTARLRVQLTTLDPLADRVHKDFPTLVLRDERNNVPVDIKPRSVIVPRVNDDRRTILILIERFQGEIIAGPISRFLVVGQTSVKDYGIQDSDVEKDDEFRRLQRLESNGVDAFIFEKLLGGAQRTATIIGDENLWLSTVTTTMRAKVSAIKFRFLRRVNEVLSRHSRDSGRTVRSRPWCIRVRSDEA